MLKLRRRYFYYVTFKACKGNINTMYGSSDVNTITKLDNGVSINELAKSIATEGKVDSVMIVNFKLLKTKWELC
jgi:hypothetical protein